MDNFRLTYFSMPKYIQEPVVGVARQWPISQSYLNLLFIQAHMRTKEFSWIRNRGLSGRGFVIHVKGPGLIPGISTFFLWFNIFSRRKYIRNDRKHGRQYLIVWWGCYDNAFIVINFVFDVYSCTNHKHGRIQREDRGPDMPPPLENTKI